MRAKLDPRLPERWQPYYASQNLAGSCVWHFFSANTLVLPSSRKPFHSNPHNPVLNLKLLRTSALEIRTSHCWWLLSSQNHSIPNPLTLTQPWGSLRLLRRRWSGGFWGFLQEGGGEGGGFKKAMGKPPFPSPPPFLEEAPPCRPLKKSGTPQSGRSASIMNLCPKNCCTAVFKSATLPLSGSNKATASAWQRHLKFRAAISHFLHGACCRFAFQLHGSGTFSSCGN